MAKREVQEINAGSMADIAFLLLIFFLVTTTMDSDTGLLRKLPAIQDPTEKQDDPDQINQRNLLEVKVNKDNLLLVEGDIINFSDLRRIAKEFIANEIETPLTPEKIDKEIQFFGLVRVSKNAVISLQNDIGTTYGVYIAVQNELLAARDELKDMLASSKFGMLYDDLNQEQMEAVDKYYNVPISEAEPRKIGEN